jgi:hypothetical protein
VLDLRVELYFSSRFLHLIDLNSICVLNSLFQEVNGFLKG